LKDVRDVKRLYLSGSVRHSLSDGLFIFIAHLGNPMANDFMQDACYNLIYLELAACRLTSLPPKFSALVPNLRVLNLNYNFLKDIKPLEGLARLKKLTIIGSRLTGTKALIRCVKGMPDVEMLDFRYVMFFFASSSFGSMWGLECREREDLRDVCHEDLPPHVDACTATGRVPIRPLISICLTGSHRMNPCTLGWYLPLLVRDLPGALQPSEGRDGAGRTSADAAGSKSSGKSSVDSWQALDAKFRRDLPDETYVGRLAYRGLVMRSCANIRLLDGVDVTDKEKEKASRLLVGIMNKQQQQQPPAVASAVRVLGP
jgi:protein NUD1